MQGYELTGRGKVLIAVILVILVAALIIWGSSLITTPDEPPHDTDAIHQNDTGTAQPESEPEPETVTGGAPSLQNGDNEEPDEPSLSDVTVFDIETGILTFQFAPDTQTTLDEGTVLLIGELLTSPQYTAASVFAVEIPHLSDEDDTARLTTAILEAFKTLDIPLGKIVFFVYQPQSDTGTFEIRILLK